MSEHGKPPKRGDNMPIVPLGERGRLALQLMDQAHGHVMPRPDGRRAQCAGPAGCWTCHLESVVYESKMKFFIHEAMVIKPGDKILLIAPELMDREIIKEHTEALKRRFPDVEITIVDGFTGVQVAGNNV